MPPDFNALQSRVVVLAGLPGCGKSTIARVLRDEYGFFILSRDTIMRTLFGFDDVGSAQKEIAFEALLKSLPVLTSLGRSVVVDGAPFGYEGQAEAVVTAAQPSPAYVVYVATPIEVCRQRLEITDLDAGPASRVPSLVDEVASRFRQLPDWWRTVDGEDSPGLSAARIVALFS